MASDGTLIFDTKIDTSGFEKAVSKLAKSGENASKSVGDAISEELPKKAKKAKKAVKETSDSVDELSNKSKKTKQSTDSLGDSVDKTSDSVDKLGEKTKKTKESTETFGDEVDKTDKKTKDHKETLDDTADSVDNFGKKYATAGEMIKGILGAQIIQEGARVLFDFSKKSIQLASDLEEVQNVVDVTFGQGAEDVNRFAKEASTAFGLTELQAKQFTGTMGAMLKSMGLSEIEAKDMSISMVGLVGDMASFYNLDHETAFEKIRSGLAGETEPLRQLGINMSVANLEAYRLSKGIETAFDSMSEAEKTQLRYAYLMEQTADAQGDFSRTQDSFANQVRILSNNIDTLAANIGSKLLPFASSAVSAINSLFSGSGETEPAVVGEINGIIDNLEGLKDTVSEINNDFLRETIKINVDYGEAQRLISLLEQLEESGDENYASQLKQSIQELVDLYPELAQYVGEDGLLTIELNEVEELIDGYRRLAIEKAVASRVEATTEAYYNAFVDLELLKQKRQQAEQELQTAEETVNKLEALREKFFAANEKLQTSPTESSFLGLTITSSALQDPATIQAVTDAMREYIEVIGGLSPEMIDELSAGGVDLTKIFGADGQLLTPDEISATTDGLNALFDAYNNLLGGNLSPDATQNPLGMVGESIETAVDDVGALEDAVNDAAAKVEEFQPQVEALKSEMDLLTASKDEIVNQISDAGTQAGAQAGSNMQQALSDQKSGLVSEVGSIGNALQAEANRHPIRYTATVSTPSISGYSSTSHATGLYRVPYDNYYARLHAGERVLTAAEAREYNRNESASTSMPQEPIVIEQPPQTIVVEIGGNRFAEAQVESNRIALNNLSKKIAQGRGSR